MVSRYRWEKWTHEEETLPFIEVVSGLAGNAGEDEAYSLRSVLGLQLNDQWTLAGIHTYTEMKELKGIQRLGAGAVFYKFNAAWSLMFGAGVFESTLREEKITAFGQLKWAPYKGVSLF